MVLSGRGEFRGLFGLKVVQRFQNELILADGPFSSYETHVKFILDKAFSYSVVIYTMQSAGSGQSPETKELGLRWVVGG